MEPSSLVFVVIIGVWAAYLLPSWLHRRVHLSQSRTRDRFSSGVRVLTRREWPATNREHRSGGPVLTRSAAELPPAAAEPETTESEATEPAAAESVATKPAGRAPVAKGAVAAEPAADPFEAEPMVTVPIGAATVARVRKAERAAYAVHTGALARARVAARRRARVMVLLMAVSTAGWTAFALTSTGLWAGVAPTVLLVLHAAAGRLAAVRSQRVLAVTGARLHGARRRLELATAAMAEGSAPERTPVPAEPVAAPAVAAGAETWTPVPVPPPTYTLKPAVHRPEPAPLEPAAQDRTAREVAARAEPVGRIRVPGRVPARPEDDGYEQRAVVNG